MSALIRIIVLVLFTAGSAHAQVVLNSGSNGTDGALALTVTTPGEPREVIFDPIAMGLDTDRDNVFHFTTITIGPGVTVRMRFNKLQGAPVIWLATGAVQIDGTIDLNGEPGADAASGVTPRVSVPGPGGYPGGAGSGPGFGNTAGRGFGPGAGNISAGHAFTAFSFGPAYGNALLVPLRGGSGGSGTGNSSTPGSGGGAGGGALRIFSSTSIAVNGAITADGGNGGAGPGFDDDAGGGSGGGIHLIAPIISGTGTLSAAGGRYRERLDGLFDASVGRVRLDAASNQFSGVSNALLTRGTPYNVPLPEGMPSVRVTSIAGTAIPLSPTGEAATPDVTFDQAGPVAVTVEARNIPPGTVVQIRVQSEAAPEIVVNAPALQGTQQFSTTTANVTFPPGFSRGFVRATWSPPQ